MPSRHAKSPDELSQVSVPSVTPISSVSADLCSSQKATSLATQGEAAASGDASTIRKREFASACSIDDQRPGVAESEVSSRKTRSTRRLNRGLPSRWIADCNADAIGLSLAWLYEMKASYRAMARLRCGRQSHKPRVVCATTSSKAGPPWWRRFVAANFVLVQKLEVVNIRFREIAAVRSPRRDPGFLLLDQWAGSGYL